MRFAMHDEPVPRELPERTGRHYCVRCMALVSAEEYQRNDHICDACAADDEYPPPKRTMNDER